MINVLIADDHEVVREGIRRIISTTSDIAVVDEASNGDDALQKILAAKHDVAMLDISMPGLSGLDIIQQLKKDKSTAPKVIIMSIYPEQQYAEKAMRSGAYAYLNKGSGKDELLSAIRTVYQGSKYITKAFAERLASSFEIGIQRLPHETLSYREFTILCMIGFGKTCTEISQELLINTSTVSTYRARILDKMGMKSNAEMIRYVLENKLTCDNSPITTLV